MRTELYLPPAFQQQEDWLAARDAFRQLVDITENQALAHNFQGKDWTRERDWLLVDYTLTGENASGIVELTDYTNQLRRYFRQDIFGSLKNIQETKTNREAAGALYQFLLSAGVEQQLIHWRDQAISQGKLEQARNHEQTWQALIDLLDEFVAIYGDDPFEQSLFEEVLMTGLENLTFGKIPTAIDQVNINRLI